MSPSRPAIGVTTEAASRYEVKIQAAPEGVVCEVALQHRQRRHDERLEQRVRTAPEGEHAQDQAMVN